MKYAILAVLVVTVAAMASERTAGIDVSNHFGQSRGTYTIVSQIAGGLSASYGLAIKDNVANSIWILNWSDLKNYEFEMDTGDPTGNSWDITGGVDPDDQAYALYGDGQWFMTDYASSFFAVFDEDGTFNRNIDGPAGYTNLFGIGAGYGNIYLGSPNESVLAWGAYTGSETSITWDGEIPYESVYGCAVWGNYLFIACGIENDVNIIIHELEPDGTPIATPVWSTIFFEAPVNGGIDYDGTYLYIYPQNDYIYVLDIDFTPGALEQSTWGAIKAGI